MSQYVAPARNLNAFNCPHCGVYAHQTWKPYYIDLSNSSLPAIGLHGTKCAHCHRLTAWRDDMLIYPRASVAPMPSDDMPEEVAVDFREARDVLDVSPRASAALLRLALQKLCRHLGERGKDINHDIGQLVKKGLSPQVQQAMDAVRIVGNNAVHPGELDMQDNQDTAVQLFSLVNMVIYEMITRPREIARLYGNLPQSARDAVEQRDKASNS